MEWNVAISVFFSYNPTFYANMLYIHFESKLQTLGWALEKSYIYVYQV